jgi:hypothetical protein
VDYSWLERTYIENKKNNKPGKKKIDKKQKSSRVVTTVEGRAAK